MKCLAKKQHADNERSLLQTNQFYPCHNLVCDVHARQYTHHLKCWKRCDYASNRPTRTRADQMARWFFWVEENIGQIVLFVWRRHIHNRNLQKMSFNCVVKCRLMRIRQKCEISMETQVKLLYCLSTKYAVLICMSGTALTTHIDDDNDDTQSMEQNRNWKSTHILTKLRQPFYSFK